MQPKRGLIPLLIATSLLFAFLLYHLSPSISLATMSITTTTTTTTTTSKTLIATLRQTSPVGSGPLIISARIHNSGASPASILVWNSPLDPLAAKVGVFTLTTAVGDVVDASWMRVNRQLPPGKEEVITIPADGEVEVEHVFRMYMLDSGRYTVRATWRWMQIWGVEAEEVTEEMLRNTGITGEGEDLNVEIEVEV
jgi:hypothetical protein